MYGIPSPQGLLPHTEEQRVPVCYIIDVHPAVPWDRGIIESDHPAVIADGKQRVEVHVELEGIMRPSAPFAEPLSLGNLSIVSPDYVHQLMARGYRKG